MGGDPTTPIYVSPSGTSGGAGTAASPVDLITGLAHLYSTGTMYFMDGIYETDYLTLRANMSAAPGARPVIVGTDGYPPAIAVVPNASISGLWIGGLRPASNVGSREIAMGLKSIIQDCTFFNYCQCIINGSDAHANIFRRNRFVTCGWESLQHPLYVANLNSNKAADGVLSEENIMVGCEGFSVHYYHQPSYGLAQYNFIGDALNGLALQGDVGGPVSGNRNIIWAVSGTPLYNITETGTCDNNVWRGCEKPNLPDDGNFFVDPVPTAGTNPVVWQEADVVSNLGNSSANIDTAIAALEASFGGTVTQIYNDATIETNFAVLKSVIDTWKTK